MPVIVSLIRCSMLEAKGLGRTLGIWPLVAVILWPILIKLQEPDFFQAQGVPFYWASQEAMMMVLAGLLPLAIRFAQGPDSGGWAEQISRSAWLPVLGSWLGVVFYGTGLVGLSVLSGFTLERILPGRPAPWLEACSAAGTEVAFLVAIASASFSVARISWSTPATVFLWLCVLAVALHLLGPIAQDFSASSLRSPGILGILSTLCATLGGLALSLAHGFFRLRRT